jgi:hypothetical protein
MDEDSVSMAQIFESPQDNRIDTPETIPPEPSSGFPAGFPDRRSPSGGDPFAGSIARIWDRAGSAASAQLTPRLHRTNRLIPGPEDISRLIDPVRFDKIRWRAVQRLLRMVAI